MAVATRNSVYCEGLCVTGDAADCDHNVPGRRSGGHFYLDCARGPACEARRSCRVELNRARSLARPSTASICAALVHRFLRYVPHVPGFSHCSGIFTFGSVRYTGGALRVIGRACATLRFSFHL
jgi:hypothetical protein